MGGHKFRRTWLVDHYPDAYLSMGLTAQRLAQRFGITREQREKRVSRCAAIRGRWQRFRQESLKDETVLCAVSFTTANGSKPKKQEIIFKTDEGRAPTHRSKHCSH